MWEHALSSEIWNNALDTEFEAANRHATGNKTKNIRKQKQFQS